MKLNVQTPKQGISGLTKSSKQDRNHLSKKAKCGTEHNGGFILSG
jgi:hypothetical protein